MSNWGVCGKGGVCMAKGGMRGEGGHAWQGACVVKGGIHGKGGWMVKGEGECMAGETATAAGGTHPTGMHCC